MIPLFYPFVPKEAIDGVVDTLKSQWIGQGPKVNEFERQFGQKFNTNFNVMLNSGSSALETAFDLLGITNGDEVITTPLTCTATNLPLIRRGAKLVWADIQEGNLCLDPKDVLRKITGKTKAIVNVHLGGIENTLGEMPVPIVADACQALGVFNGDYTCCSFQAIKHITTCDGGLLVCPDEKQYKQAKLMRWFGIDRERKIKENWQAYRQRAMTFDIEVLGYKRQPTDLMAAMGLAGLKYYDRIIQHLTHLYQTYCANLKDVFGIKIVDGRNNTHWLMTVLVEDREGFARKMFEKGIDTNMVQVRNDIYKIFGGKRQDLPVMNHIEDKYISLPINMKVTEDDVKYICDAIRQGW